MNHTIFRTIYAKLILCLLLVILSDILLYYQPIGWNIAVFASTLFISILLRNGRNANSYSINSRILIFLSSILILSLYENISILSIAMNLIALITISLSDNKKWQLNSIEWLIRVRKFFLSSWLSLFNDILNYRSLNATKQLNKVSLLRSWTLPIFVSLGFVLMFYDANPIIYRFLNKISFADELNKISFKRFFYWILVASLCWKLIRVRITIVKSRLRFIPRKALYSAYSYLFIKDSIFKSLIIFNIMFFTQNVMDVKYLWIKSEIPEGLSIAQYAHKGAYTLVITAILAGLFSILCLKSDGAKLTKWLINLWITQNIFLVISSIWRVLLYIDSYSLTYLRSAALIWMAIVALGLLFIIIRITYNKSSIWLLNINIITVLSVLYLSCFVNFGYFISNYNVNSSIEKSGNCKGLDVFYLQRIGISSLPAINNALRNIDVNSREYRQLIYIRNNLEDELNKKMSNWSSWTYRNHRMLAEVSK